MDIPEKKTKDLYTLTQKDDYVLVTKHLWKWLLSLLAMAFFIAVANRETINVPKVMIVIVIFVLMGIVLDWYLRKNAAKITIDFNRDTIAFVLCRTDEIKYYPFSAIVSIKKTFNTTFIFKNELIRYNAGKNEELDMAITRIRNRIAAEEKRV